MYSGENNFVVWIKRPNTKPANKTGYDTREHYTIKTPTSETAKINQVTINQIDEAVGVTPIIGVKSSSKTKVQYKIQLYSSTLNIWEDASNGYCAPVEASSLTKISTLIPLKPGKNTYKVYVKPHGIQSSESSITKDVVVDSTLTKIDFCAINPFKIKVGNTPEVDIVTSSTEKSIQYRIFSYSYTLNKWDEIMAYSSEYPSSKELTLPLNTTVKKGKNKYLIWAKSSLVEGNGYEDF
ncbi:MAG: hypothetical protein RSB66_05545, partial [Clostridium sp.]